MVDVITHSRAQGREAPGFHNLGFLASNRAYEGGLKSVRDLEGKIVGCTAIGDIGYLGLRTMIDAQGGDSSKVKWVEIPTSAAGRRRQ